MSVNLQLPNHSVDASCITLNLLGCFLRHKILIHIIRSNWNFGELTQRSIKFMLRVYSNKSF